MSGEHGVAGSLRSLVTHLPVLILQQRLQSLLCVLNVRLEEASYPIPDLLVVKVVLVEHPAVVIRSGPD